MNSVHVLMRINGNPASTFYYFECLTTVDGKLFLIEIIKYQLSCMKIFYTVVYGGNKLFIDLFYALFNL